MCKKRAFLELYEFELKGYPKTNTPVETKKMRYTDKDECGVIEFNNFSSNEVYLRSNKDFKSNCDVITTDKPDASIRDNAYYSAYLKYKPKSQNVKIDNTLEDTLYNKKNLEELIDININLILEYFRENSPKTTQEIVQKDINDNMSIHDAAFVYNINVHSSEKIIVFGDLHGSFHTFYRHILRLQKSKVLDEAYELNKNYRIVFLGDVLDRGQYSLEILRYILKMMLKNNSKDKLKVIFNRGNHENEDMYGYGPNSFENELKNKKLSELLPKFRNFFSRLSSAVILNCDGNRIWLSHGGIPNTDIKYDVSNLNIIFYHNSKSNLASQIRWNDFISVDKYKRSDRLGPKSKETMFNITPEQINKFCETNNINFIIRGHQDRPYNSYILSRYDSITKKMDQIDGKLIFGYNGSDILCPNEYIFINKNKNTDNKIISGPIASVLLDRHIDSKVLNFTEKDLRLKSLKLFYPVITLSTCTDYDRDLTHDSFGLIRFDIFSVNEYNTVKTLMGGFRNLQNDIYYKYKENKYMYDLLKNEIHTA